MIIRAATALPRHTARIPARKEELEELRKEDIVGDKRLVHHTGPLRKILYT